MKPIFCCINIVNGGDFYINIDGRKVVVQLRARASCMCVYVYVCERVVIIDKTDDDSKAMIKTIRYLVNLIGLQVMLTVVSEGGEKLLIRVIIIKAVLESGKYVLLPVL